MVFGIYGGLLYTYYVGHMATTQCRQDRYFICATPGVLLYTYYVGHMAKLVDALDLGSSGVTHQSSSLCMPTMNKKTLDFYGDLP